MTNELTAGASNPKKKAIFVVRGSSLIGKCQNMEIDFFENATLKSHDGTTSYTLYQPWVNSRLMLIVIFAFLK